MRPLEDFIGLPWRAGGRGFDGVDCVGLTALAARELFGLDSCGLEVNCAFTDPEGALEKLSKITRRVGEPLPGDVILFKVRGSLHTGIFVPGGRVLYIVRGGTSRTVRYRQWLKNHTEAIFRKER